MPQWTQGKVAVVTPACGPWQDADISFPSKGIAACLVYCADDEYRVATFDGRDWAFSALDTDRWGEPGRVVRWAQILQPGETCEP